MTTVTITLPPGSQVVSAANKVTLSDNLGNVVTLPVTDAKVNLNEQAPNWVEVPKPGLIEPPFTVRGPRPLRFLNLTITIVNPGDMLSDITPLIKKIKQVIGADRITLAYSALESAIAESGNGFVCTSFQPQVVMRDPATNNPIQATGSITLKEANLPPSAANAGAAKP